MKPFKKMSEINELLPTRFVKKFYQKWDDAAKKYLNSETELQGYSKKYLFETADFLIQVTATNLGEMFTENFDGVKSEILNKKYNVWHNGKEGKEVRHVLFLAKENKQVQELNVQAPEDVITDENGVAIPF